MTLQDAAEGAASVPKDVVHTAVKEVETVLNTATSTFQQFTAVAGKTAGATNTEAQALLDRLEGALEEAYTQVTDLLHLTKPPTQ